MSSKTKKAAAAPIGKTVKPKTRPRPAPKATVPPAVRPAFGRPTAASPAQRRKRSEARHKEEPSGSVTAKNLAAGEGEILLFGTIGQDWFGEGITGVSFNDSLKALGDVSTIRLRINSGGGDVFEATAIYNALVKHEARIVVEIEGVAASAATLISMAGDEIRISENAHFMIHAASGIAWGNAEQIRQYLKLLDNADELIRLTYSRRTGISSAELVGMMDHDNWMTAQEAFDLGFVDVIDEAKTVEPHTSPEQPDNSIGRRPQTMTDERLESMQASLLSLSQEMQAGRLAASANPTFAMKTPGSSPLSVSHEKEDSMKLTAKLRAKCVAAGMPANLSDPEALAWYEKHEDTVLTGGRVASLSGEPQHVLVTAAESLKPGLTADEILNLVEAREKRKLEARKAWRSEVDANIQLAFGDDPPAKLVEACYELQDDGITAVRAKIQEAKKSASESAAENVGTIVYSPSQPRDRHIAAIRAGVMVRALRNFKAPAPRLQQQPDGRWTYASISESELLEKHFPEKDRPKDWEAFAQMPLIKIAEECLTADGVSYEQLRRLPGPNVAMAAMGYYRQSGLRASAAQHTTGSMLEITRDAVNKSLRAGYEEAPQTWRGPMRQGASVSDFKDIRRVTLGAAGNLPVWPDNTAPNQAKLSNESERYAVEARAQTLSFSWRLIVNDDLDALSRRPQLMGDAAARTVNAVAWSQVTSNPTMGDGQTLFLETPAGNRKRKNLTTGSATPTNTTIGAMKALMRLMRGLNTPEGNESEDVLNLMPAFIVGPASLEELILKQVFSGADPAASGNSAVFNTSRTLTPIIEPLLDANSTTAWYLFASPGRIDTIEVTFLAGQETPFAHEWMDDETMSQNYTIIQTFGAAPIDHRGIQKHAGA